LIKNPEKPIRKFPDLVSESAKPSKRLQSYAGFWVLGFLLQIESNGIEAHVLKGIFLGCVVDNARGFCRH
jgi:hypothetical protein